MNTNLVSQRAAGVLSRNQRGLSKTMGHVSSGKRIDRAADDAAGLAVAENLDTRSRSERQAQRNIQDGISLIEVAEGAYDQFGNIIKRMRELAVQSATETYTDKERAYMKEEWDQITNDANRIRQTTQFAGQDLMSYAGGWDYAPHVFSVQVGVDNTANDRIDITIQQPFNVFTMMTEFPAAIGRPVNIDAPNWGIETAEKAQASLSGLDDMLLWNNYSRTQLGVTHNRLQHALNNLEVSNENTSAAESRIRDADMAFQTAALSKGQILNQAATAVLGQANGLNQSVLRLI